MHIRVTKETIQFVVNLTKEIPHSNFVTKESTPKFIPGRIASGDRESSLRFCVDYRGLNEGTIKNRYPLPWVKETFMQLSRAKIFTKLDIRRAFNLIRMRAREE